MYARLHSFFQHYQNKFLESWQQLSRKQKLYARAGAIGLALLVLYGIVALFSTGNAHQNTPPAVRISAATAEAKDMPITLDVVGTVNAYESVAVTSRIDSQITEILFRDGQPVQKGDVLIQLDDRMLKAEYAKQQATLLQDTAQMQIAKKQRDRYAKLAAQGYESAEKYEEIKATYEAEQAAVAAAKAALHSLSVQLDYTTIRAPISGRTGTINVTKGNNVKANDQSPIVTIHQVQPIRVHISLPARYYDDVRHAMEKGTLSITVVRNDQQGAFTGKLEYIDNAVDTSTGTFAARAIFDNKDEALWPGMFVHASLQLGIEKQAVIVPEVAIQQGQDIMFVFLIKDKKAVKTPVKVSRHHEGMAVITEGVQAGDQVVTDGMLRLSDGSAIEIKPVTSAVPPSLSHK